ncbi:peptide-methionine (S)-S-oxide reductase [Enterococcus sp. AZ194]
MINFDEFGQFADRGESYRPVIFYTTEEQRESAEASKKQLQNSGRFTQPIVTKIEKAQPFYPAEDYHQEYYKKNKQHYERYREGSGRAAFLRKSWQE